MRNSALGALVSLFLGFFGFAKAQEPTATPAAAVKISGEYEVEGGGGGESSYTGRVKMVENEHAHAVTWLTTEGVAQATGIGLREGDVLSVCFRSDLDAAFAGVAVFQVHPNGKLTGRWATFSQPGTVFEERLSPVKADSGTGASLAASLRAATQGLGQAVPETVDIVGAYQVEGVSDVNETYTGTAEISRTGSVVGVRWVTGESKLAYVGVGLRTGDLLSVSFRSEADPAIGVGLMVYRIGEGPALTGKWTAFGHDGPAMTETLTRVKR